MKTLRSEEGKEVLEYLKSERGLTDKIIDLFQIGFCPDRVNHELSGKIIIPVLDTYGEPVAISTRNPGNRRDFWHESYDKIFYLYGLYIAKLNILFKKKAILVEGEFDVMSLHQYGFSTTVGVCGSSFSIFQASVLARYCKKIYLLFDSDVAGEQAIKKVLEMKKEKLYNVDFIPVYLPGSTDPDEYIRKNGKNKLIELLEGSKVV